MSNQDPATVLTWGAFKERVWPQMAPYGIRPSTAVNLYIAGCLRKASRWRSFAETVNASSRAYGDDIYAAKCFYTECLHLLSVNTDHLVAAARGAQHGRSGQLIDPAFIRSQEAGLTLSVYLRKEIVLRRRECLCD